MSGEQFREIDKPYYRQWQKRVADAKLVKPGKPHKKGKKKAKR